MKTRYRVMPAVRGYKVFDEHTGRTLSLHPRCDDAIHRASMLARTDHVEVEVLDENGEPVTESAARRARAPEGSEAGVELVDEPGMERMDDDPVLEQLDELL